MFSELKGFQASDLDLNSGGDWPVLVKAIFFVILFVAVCGGGWWFVVKAQQTSLDQAIAKESQLKQSFEAKAFQVANIVQLREQMVEMEEQFGALLRQLPSDTEVPGLLEDITSTGTGSGLEFESINLLPEIQREYYVELPIEIKVQGNYHELGAFVSGVAGLPRIVTLHDFSIQPAGADQLNLQILARTYRYRDDS